MWVNNSGQRPFRRFFPFREFAYSVVWLWKGYKNQIWSTVFSPEHDSMCVRPDLRLKSSEAMENSISSSSQTWTRSPSWTHSRIFHFQWLGCGKYVELQFPHAVRQNGWFVWRHVPVVSLSVGFCTSSHPRGWICHTTMFIDFCCFLSVPPLQRVCVSCKMRRTRSLTLVWNCVCTRGTWKLLWVMYLIRRGTGKFGWMKLFASTWVERLRTR